MGACGGTQSKQEKDDQRQMAQQKLEVLTYTMLKKLQEQKLLRFTEEGIRWLQTEKQAETIDKYTLQQKNILQQEATKLIFELDTSKIDARSKIKLRLFAQKITNQNYRNVKPNTVKEVLLDWLKNYGSQNEQKIDEQIKSVKAASQDKSGYTVELDSLTLRRTQVVENQYSILINNSYAGQVDDTQINEKVLDFLQRLPDELQEISQPFLHPLLLQNGGDLAQNLLIQSTFKQVCPPPPTKIQDKPESEQKQDSINNAASAVANPVAQGQPPEKAVPGAAGQAPIQRARTQQDDSSKDNEFTALEERVVNTPPLQLLKAQNYSLQVADQLYQTDLQSLSQQEEDSFNEKSWTKIDFGKTSYLRLVQRNNFLREDLLYVKSDQSGKAEGRILQVRTYYVKEGYDNDQTFLKSATNTKNNDAKLLLPAIIEDKSRLANGIIALDRGLCTLEKYIQRRRIINQQLTPEEIFYLARSIGSAISSYAQGNDGFCLCDFSPDKFFVNITPDGKGLYLIAQHFGSQVFWFSKAQQTQAYPTLLNKRYFDLRLLTTIFDKKEYLQRADIEKSEMFGLVRLLQYLVFDETQHMYELFNKQSEIKNFLKIYKLEGAAKAAVAAGGPPKPSYRAYPPTLVQLLQDVVDRKVQSLADFVTRVTAVETEYLASKPKAEYLQHLYKFDSNKKSVPFGSLDYVQLSHNLEAQSATRSLFEIEQQLEFKDRYMTSIAPDKKQLYDRILTLLREEDEKITKNKSTENADAQQQLSIFLRRKRVLYNLWIAKVETDPKKCEEKLKESAKLLIDVKRSKEIDMSIVQQALGRLYLSQDDKKAEAVKAFEESLKIAKVKLEPNSLQLSAIKDILATAYLENKEYENSENAYLETEKILRTKVDPDRDFRYFTPNTEQKKNLLRLSEVFKNIAIARYHQDLDVNTVTTYLDQSQKLLEQKFIAGQTSESYYQVLYYSAKCYQKREKYQDAITQYEAAIEVLTALIKNLESTVQTKNTQSDDPQLKAVAQANKPPVQDRETEKNQKKIKKYYGELCEIYKILGDYYYSQQDKENSLSNYELMRQVLDKNILGEKLEAQKKAQASQAATIDPKAKTPANKQQANDLKQQATIAVPESLLTFEESQLRADAYFCIAQTHFNLIYDNKDAYTEYQQASSFYKQSREALEKKINEIKQKQPQQQDTGLEELKKQLLKSATTCDMMVELLQEKLKGGQPVAK